VGKNVHRRDVIRAVPLVLFGSAIAGFGRFLLGCAVEDSTMPGRKVGTGGPGTATPPNDGDEFTPPTGEPPIVANETPPTVPSSQWEARARQLEDEQTRLYGAVFTTQAPGVMDGKQRSHVPQVTNISGKGLKRVSVLVMHVMGKNGLDAGAVDASGSAADAADAARDAADAGDAARDAEAGAATDAGKPVVHYITTMYLRAEINGKDTVVGLWELLSTDAAPPTVEFTLPAGVTSVVAYEWCTLHGLWKADHLSV
jgi:desulfoferrodoxin (superoxide reductase-like protein)